MMDQDQITKDWNRRGYSCDLWTDPAGQAWENFVHAVDEIVMLIEGTIALEIQGQFLKPEPGQEIVIPANTLHSVRNTGGTTIRGLYGYKQNSPLHPA